MKAILTLVFGATVFTTAPVITQAQQKMTVEAAERICLVRVQRFANLNFGDDTNSPEPSQITDRFRACVYANSGQYPKRRLQIRGTDVTLPTE